MKTVKTAKTQIKEGKNIVRMPRDKQSQADADIIMPINKDVTKWENINCAINPVIIKNIYA